MSPEEESFVRAMGIALALIYVVSVGVFSLLKATFGLEQLPWAEVVYGPAITTASIFLIYLGAMGIEHLIRARKGGR